MQESMSLPSGNLSPGIRGRGVGDRAGDQWRKDYSYKAPRTLEFICFLI